MMQIEERKALVDREQRAAMLAELAEFVRQYREHEAARKAAEKELKKLYAAAKREFGLTTEALELEILKHREAGGWRPSPRSRVYFLHVRQDDLVKIGVTEHLDTRITSLVSGLKKPCALVGHIAGDRVTERVIHHQFRAHRQHGEFFKWTPISEQVRGMVARNSGLLLEHLR